MRKYISRLTLLSAVVLSISAISLALTFPNVALAAVDPKGAACEGVALTGSTCGTTAGPTVQNTVAVVINIFSFLVGVAAVIMIIIGGFKYIISSGDSSNIKSAKDTILYALIGVVVVALAQVLVRFVIGKVPR